MKVPIIKYNNKLCYWDEKSKQIRNIEDPADAIPFAEVDINKIQEP